MIEESKSITATFAVAVLALHYRDAGRSEVHVTERVIPLPGRSHAFLVSPPLPGPT